jgi:hypothetical protein
MRPHCRHRSSVRRGASLRALVASIGGTSPRQPRALRAFAAIPAVCPLRRPIRRPQSRSSFPDFPGSGLHGSGLLAGCGKNPSFVEIRRNQLVTADDASTESMTYRRRRAGISGRFLKTGGFPQPARRPYLGPIGQKPRHRRTSVRAERLLAGYPSFGSQRTQFKQPRRRP